MPDRPFFEVDCCREKAAIHTQLEDCNTIKVSPAHVEMCNSIASMKQDTAAKLKSIAQQDEQLMAQW